jgi:hypothetical protein
MVEQKPRKVRSKLSREIYNPSGIFYTRIVKDKTKYNRKEKYKMMLTKTIFSAIILSLLLVGCTHKDEKSPEKAPHKVHNKFHHKYTQEEK